MMIKLLAFAILVSLAASKKNSTTTSPTWHSSLYPCYVYDTSTKSYVVSNNAVKWIAVNAKSSTGFSNEYTLVLNGGGSKNGCSFVVHGTWEISWSLATGATGDETFI